MFGVMMFRCFFFFEVVWGSLEVFGVMWALGHGVSGVAFASALGVGVAMCAFIVATIAGLRARFHFSGKHLRLVCGLPFRFCRRSATRRLCV